MSGIVSKIKEAAKASGGNKAKLIYFRENEKVRIRFLDDMDDGHEIVFHDSYALGVNEPCRETFGKSCELCGDEELRTRSLYAWSVYDYDNNEVKVLLSAVNNCSPVPNLMAMYEMYGTITDRDYIIKSTGKQQNKTFAVAPMDKNKFRNVKAKAFSKSALLAIIEKAFPSKAAEFEEEEVDEEIPNGYSEMSAKELYALCKERGIEAETKKPAKYYINLLEEDDATSEAWDEEAEWSGEEDDEWE